MTLWAGRVGGGLASEVWEFLRGDDAELLPYDCAATLEHARRLQAAGILDDGELQEVEAKLSEIDAVGPEDEDVHSAIERQLGEVGRKIHAGRSRNDQVAAALRLYVRDACREADEAIRGFCSVLLDRADAEAETPMPGYTHLQRAIAVTVGHHGSRPPMRRRRRRRSARARLPARRFRSRRRRASRFATRSTRLPTGTSRSTTSMRARSCSRISRGSARSSSCGRRASSASRGCPSRQRRAPR
jgi:argininosuccinate lyase